MSDTKAVSVTTGMEERYLVFAIADQMVGIDISRVREIIEYRPVAKVPLSPLYMHGILNLRGHVVPVIDLLALTERKQLEVTKRTCIVIVEIGESEESVVAGLLADNVQEVATMPESDIDTSDSLRSRFRQDLLHGIGRMGDQFIVLLNTNMLVHLEEIFSVHQSAGYQHDTES